MIHEASRMSPAEMKELNDSTDENASSMIDWDRRVDEDRTLTSAADAHWNQRCRARADSSAQKADVPNAAHVLGRVDRAGGQIAEQTIELVHGRERDAGHHAHDEKRPTSLSAGVRELGRRNAVESHGMSTRADPLSRPSATNEQHDDDCRPGRTRRSPRTRRGR